jgi:alpha-glucosidase
MTTLERGTLLERPHHDGSDLYVLERPEEPGGEATLRVRVPAGADVEAVHLRAVRDGEPLVVRAEVDEEADGETWWRASFRPTAAATHYRWLLSGPGTYAWLTSGGTTGRGVSDADDFVLSLDPGGPDWHLSSVVYEIYPDRFASSGLGSDPPEWAVPRRWDELPTGRGPTTAREWFGGDLRGVEQRLDHVASLGADVIYTTPFFPAGSTHRYDATTFDRVDPLLGGDEALRSLLRVAHDRGIRVLGDLTLNHVGKGHDWFLAARAGAGAERGFFYFDDAQPSGYACWLGVPSLPKLNWASGELRRRLDAAMRRWLDEGLDGWRIDVANMVARYGDYDANAEARALARRAVGEKLLVAEHGHDFRPDLAPGGWHGVMNYAGFLRPVWWWLRGPDVEHDVFSDAPAPRYSGADAVATMQAFRAGVPWQAALHSWALLDSHDTPRFRTVAGSRGHQLVGVGLQATSPGVPMVFAGAELGLEGEWGEDARRPMPWDRPADWDTRLLAEYRRLLALRRSSGALARGGIRYVHVSDDAIAYLRETPSERLLCLAARAPHDPITVPFDGLETLYGDDARGHELPADGPAFHVWRIHG